MNKEIMRRLGSFESVEELQKNQLVIYFENGKLFLSYGSPIAAMIEGEDKYYLFQRWNYSNTTAKYRNKFLNKTGEEIRRDIDNGRAIIID